MTASLRHAVILALATFQGFAQAGSQRTLPKPSNSKQSHDFMHGLIKAFAGSLAIQLSSVDSESGLRENAGDGEEIWRPGPGSNSLIEEYHSTGTEGEITRLGIYWQEESVLRVFWCGNTAPVACRILQNTTDWREGRLVLSDERYEEGKKRFFQETFVFDTPDSFTQTLAQGKSVDTL